MFGQFVAEEQETAARSISRRAGPAGWSGAIRGGEDLSQGQKEWLEAMENPSRKAAKMAEQTAKMLKGRRRRPARHSTRSGRGRHEDER